MAEQKSIFKLLKSFAGVAVLFIVPLTASYFAVNLTEKISIFKKRSEVAITAAEIVDNIHARTIYSKNMGAASITGVLNPFVKDIVLGKLPYDDPSVLSVQEVILQENQAEAVYLLNKNGIVVSYSDVAPISLTGQNFSFRPYFIQAMEGKQSIFAAQGISSNIRGVYIATPIYAEKHSDSEIIGVIVVKDSIGRIEDLLRKYEDPVFMVSPHGVVFATNRTEYLYKVAGKLNDTRKNSLASLRRFGAAFDQDAEELGAVLDGQDITLGGEKYLVKTHPIDWNDMEGRWQIAYLVNMKNILLPALKYTVYWSVFAVFFILLGTLHIALGNRRQRLEIEAQNRKIFKAVEQTPAAILITDNEGFIEYANPKFTELTEYTFEEAKGKKPAILNPELSGESCDEVWETIKTGNEWHGEFLNTKKSGETYWESVLVAPVKDRFGEITNFVSIKEDITEKKKAMTAIEDARKLAENAAESKSMFLANMSHEIRTPLNAIIGLSDLALKTELTLKQADYIRKVKNAGISLLGIVNDILDFSKIEAGKIELESVEFSLDTVLEHLITVVFQKAEEKGLEFLLHVGSDVPPVIKGDSLRLSQILINLVNNAVKFTEEGEIELSVTLVREFEGRVEIMFSVRDTGVGLLDEQRHRLFDAFSQADGSTTRKYGGTGLGLSISKKLSHLMGGEISVESEYGKGSVFAFTAVFEIGATPKREFKYGHEELKDMKVLVVDDNSSARQIIMEILENLEFEAEETDCAESAINLIKQNDASDPYKIVLMDWKMPGLNGLEASLIIKNDPDIKNTPIIALVTAFGRDLDRKIVKNYELEGFITKPVTPSSLIDGLLSVVFKSGYDKPVEKIVSVENFKGVHVLVVDDNDVNRQIAVELLEDTGAIVSEAVDGKQAVDFVLSGERCDIVFMDLQMPVMDGYEAVKLIREDKRFVELPIVAMTAHALNIEREKTRAAGMNGHITKPLIPEEIYECLKNFCITGEFGGACSVVIADSINQPDLNPIDGIDFRKGLKTVAGKTDLYIRMLGKFADSNADTVMRLRTFLGENDLKSAEMLVHSVKGVAANIGAIRLYNISDKLERLLIEGKDFVFEADRFTEEINRVIASIKNSQKEDEQSKKPSIQVSKEDFEKIINKMCSLLEDDDSEVVDYFMSVREQASAFFSEQEMKRLQKAVNNYEFEEALKILRNEI